MLPNRSRIVFSSSVMTSSSSLHSLLIFFNPDEHFLDTHLYTKTRQEIRRSWITLTLTLTQSLNLTLALTQSLNLTLTLQDKTRQDKTGQVR